MGEPELRESWFEKPPPSSIVPPPPAPARGARFGLGVLVGAVASVAGMETAHLVAARLGTPDPIAMASGLAGGATWAGFAVAALAGAPLGGVLAVVMMHGSRVATRAIFASIVSAAIWFCVHIAFVARGHAAPALVPMLAGAVVFGACIALIPRAR